MRNKKEIEEAILSNDLYWFGRDKFIKDFYEAFLKGQYSRHICIKGVWGSGKTTTVLGIINYINNLNLDTKEKPIILYFDAWKYEHYGHPLYSLLKAMQQESISIIDEIKADIESKYKFSATAKIPLFGLSFTAEDISPGKIILNEAEYVDVLNNLLIDAVAKFKQEKNNQLIIFVDELDRAKPEFVLRTLEVFHHLQSELPTNIVYSVDMDQLNSIIKHYYGSDYNAEIFVHKVFDTIVPLQKLSELDLTKYIESRMNKYEFIHSINLVGYNIKKYLDMNKIGSLRTINKLLELMKDNSKIGYFNTSKPRNMRNYFLGAESFGYSGYLELLIAILAYSLEEPLLAYNLIKGESIDKFAEFLDSKNNESEESRLASLILASYNTTQQNKVEFNNQSYNNEIMIKGLKIIFTRKPDLLVDSAVFNNLVL